MDEQDLNLSNGTQVWVYWEGENEWFEGVMTGRGRTRHSYKVKYKATEKFNRNNLNNYYFCFDRSIETRKRMKPTKGPTTISVKLCVHAGQGMFDYLFDILQHSGIQLIFLPAYSPELNPCEYCFNIMKQHLRNCHTDKPLWWEIIQACATITPEHITAEYKHALLFENIANKVSYLQ